jgi:hypothetical protein
MSLSLMNPCISKGETWDIILTLSLVSECENLSTAGIIATLVLLVLFWPAAWIPLACRSCYERYQVPIFGYPAGPPLPQTPSMVYGVPVPSQLVHSQQLMSQPVPPPNGYAPVATIEYDPSAPLLMDTR